MSDAAPSPLNDAARLRRFLRFGTETGAFVAGAQAQTSFVCPALHRCLDADGVKTVEIIAALATDGRSPHAEPAIFALAVAAAHRDDATRDAALRALPLVCQTGSHLLFFAACVSTGRGWGRGLKSAVARWYNGISEEELARDVMTSGRRYGFAHRDLVRLAHPKPDTTARRILYHWITQGWDRIGDAPHDETSLQPVWAREKARVPGTTPKTVAELIRTYHLPPETLPTGMLRDRLVWEALAETMPVSALLHHLPTLAQVGVLDGRAWQQYVAARMANAAGLDPVAVLAAREAYAHGKVGVPVPRIMDALDAAFGETLAATLPVTKRVVLAIGCGTGLRRTRVSGLPSVSPRLLYAALALRTFRQGGQVILWSQGATPLLLTPATRLDGVVKQIDAVGGATSDCAVPVDGARETGVLADAFVLIADAPSGEALADALRRYRAQTGIAARCVVVGTNGKPFAASDTGDAGILNINGFDTTVPGVIDAFCEQGA